MKSGDLQLLDRDSARGRRRWRGTTPRQILRGLALLLLFFLVALGIQWFQATYTSEAGHFPDEAGHFVSGLMIRDYLVSGFPAPPFEYAKNYYLHYPKFAIGMFPPLFHVLLGFWLLIGPGAYHGALIFLALIMACIAWQVYRFLVPEYGELAAIATAIMLIFVPLMRIVTGAVMVDSLVALFGLLVARHTARFLETGLTRDGVFLGIYAGAGCMVKGNGVGALLCPVLALVLTGRYRLLRRPGLYAAAAIVLVTAPVEWVSLTMYRKNSSFLPAGLSFSKGAAAFYAQNLWSGIGGVLLAVIAAGMIWKFLEWRKQGSQNTLWPSIYALILGSLLFHIVLSQVPDGRYLATSIAAMALFIPVAVAVLGGKARMILALAALLIVAMTNGSPSDIPMGFGAALEKLKQEGDFDKARFLVVSDALGEGAFVSDVASTDAPRPQHVVLRASKLLARTDWNSTYYVPRFHDAGDMLKHLEDLGVTYIILDRTPIIFRFTHQFQVRELVEAYKERISLEEEWPAVPGRQSRSVALYRLQFAAKEPKIKLQYFLDSTLGIELNL